MTRSPSEKIRVLVVDDEAMARRRLVELLREDSDVDEILEAKNGVVGVEMIQTEQPDLVFLDVQMPQLDGFGVIQAIGDEQMPLTIFVTAYERHAIHAFEADAVDYLLKPFSDKRFGTAITRAKSRLENSDARQFGPEVSQIVSKSVVPKELFDRLVVKSGGVIRFVMLKNVDWIEAAGAYVNLHVEGKEIFYHTALHVLAARLDPQCFVRIHRSTIVNIDSILELEPMSHGEFEVALKNGTRLRVSRTFRAELEERLGQIL